MTLYRMTCILMGLLLACTTVRAEVGEAIEPPSISVSGSAEIEAEPDFIEWTITITENHVNPVKAKELNDTKYEAVLKLAKDQKIKGDDQIAGLVSISKTYTRARPGEESTFKDYAVRRTVVLIQRDLDEFDEMLEKLAAARVEFGVEYGTTKLQALKREARLEAVKAARDKAQAMARELDQRISRPLRVVEQGADAGFDLRDAISNSVSVRRGGEQVGIRRGAVSVRCSVRVEFLLIDG